MSQTSNTAIAVIGIDIGKNSFHVVGHDARGAIVLRQKWSRGQIDENLLQRAAGPYMWVNRVILTAGRPLPVCPNQRTSPARPRRSGWCHRRSSRLDAILRVFHGPAYAGLPAEFETGSEIARSSVHAPSRIGSFPCRSVRCRCLFEKCVYQANAERPSGPHDADAPCKRSGVRQRQFSERQTFGPRRRPVRHD